MPLPRLLARAGTRLRRSGGGDGGRGGRRPCRALEEAPRRGCRTHRLRARPQAQGQGAVAAREAGEAGEAGGVMGAVGTRAVCHASCPA